jgi:[acyl-carrier-protein] S-malonyltransferase
MGAYVILFPGQGAGYPGMARELYEAFPAVRELYEQAGDVFGFDVKAMTFEGSAEDFGKTCYAQPLTYTASLASFLAARELLGAPAGVAGHSLGEYAALTAAGAVAPGTGMKMIAARAAAMEKVSGGKMCAVTGLGPEAVEELCEKAEGFVLPVNYNSPLQTVAAGDPEAVGALAALAAEAGGRATLLGVNGAFHTCRMQPAADEFFEAVKELPWRQPELPFYSNLTGGRMSSFASLPEYLAQHMVSPVRFTDEIAAMKAEGCSSFVEAAPGKVLSGLLRRIDKALSVYRAETPELLEKARESLGL